MFFGLFDHAQATPVYLCNKQTRQLSFGPSWRMGEQVNGVSYVVPKSIPKTRKLALLSLMASTLAVALVTILPVSGTILRKVEGGKGKGYWIEES
jgi:hypothetical protein